MGVKSLNTKELIVTIVYFLYPVFILLIRYSGANLLPSTMNVAMIWVCKGPLLAHIDNGDVYMAHYTINNKLDKTILKYLAMRIKG